MISEVTGLFVGLEGVLIALAPQIRFKPFRNAVAALGIFAILSSIGVFAEAIYQRIQLGYSSWAGTAFQFQLSATLFFVFVEMYALAIIIPFSQKRADPTETEP